MYTSDDYANDIDLYRIFDKGQRVSVQLLNARLAHIIMVALQTCTSKSLRPLVNRSSENSRTALLVTIHS